MLLPLAGLLAVSALAYSPVPNLSTPSAAPRSQAALDRSGDPLPPRAVARLGTLRLQHPNGVSAAAWSPDGKILAASGFDGEVVLWEVSSGRELRRLPGWGAKAHVLAFSPDGQWLALCGSVLQVWELSSGKQVIYYTFPARRPLVAFSPNSKFVSVIDVQDRLRLWELGPGFPAHLYDGPRRGAAALAVADFDDIRTLSTQEATLTRFPNALDPVTVAEANVSVRGAAFAPDARTLAVVTDKQFRLHDAVSGKELRHFDPDSGFASAPVFSADSKRVAALHDDNTARVWEVTAGKECLRLENASAPTFVSLSPDGKTLAMGAGTPSALQLWNVATGRRLLATPTHTSAVEAVAFSPDGKYAVTAARLDPAARLWEAATGKLVREFRASAGGVTSAAFSPDGRWLLTGHQGDTHGVRLWNVATGAPVRAFAAGASVAQAVFTPDGVAVVAAALGERNWQPFTNVTLWDRATGHELLHMSRDGAPACVGVAPDGRHVFAAGIGVQRWDAKTGHERPWKAVGQWEIEHVVYSPDGRWFAFSDSHNHTEIYETLAPREPLLCLDANTVAFSPDGRFVALAVQKDISIVDLSTGDAALKLVGPIAPVRALAFSSDGRRLLSGSADATALIWDVSDLANRPLFRPVRVDAPALDNAWKDLLSPQACQANRAAWDLAAIGEPAVALLKTKLHANRLAQRKEIRHLIAELDDEDFEAREHATQALAQQLDEVRAALQETLDKKPDAEVRRRLRALLAGDTNGILDESTRALRAVAILERVGTAEAQALLKQLADGAPDALLTRQARQALHRLEWHKAPGKPPAEPALHDPASHAPPSTERPRRH